MEKVPRALASTPAAFSLESRLPLERERHCKCVLLKARLRRQRLPFDTSSQFTPRRPGQKRPPNTGTALLLETPSQFTQVGGGPSATTTAPARYFLAIYSETPWPERPPNSGTALSLETSSQFTQVGGGPATTTTAPARYFLAIYSETPWPERPPNTGTALSLETSSRITQVGVWPAGALARLTAMAAWCAYRVPNASPRSWYEKKPPKKGVGSLT